MSTHTSSVPSPSATASDAVPSQFKIVGVILAVLSGVLIGSSFVFKKKGLLRSQAGHEAGEGVAYLKSPMWWIGMTMMILGEICNFVAYAFVEAIVVTPLGALSVVICAILSSIFLKEKLTFFGWLGCGLCIVGSTIIALNGPQEQTVGHILDFQKLFLAPGFLAWTGVLIATSLSIIIYFGPKYGKNNMFWYIFVCSMIGGLSVSCTTGLGAAIVTSIKGDNQFKHFFIYFLLGFVSITLVTEVLYLNKALALFNTAMVTPTYYVIFTFFTLVTTVILFQGLKSSVEQILTIVCGFLTICAGITILQMSKVDPTQLKKLDRRSTILLQAARQDTEIAEKSLSGIEDPGMDALRGSFGAFGSVIRARSAKRMSMSMHGDRRSSVASSGVRQPASGIGAHLPGVGRFERHQLYDPPVPKLTRDDSYATDISLQTTTATVTSPQPGTPRLPTIKFGEQDVAHYYPQPGKSGGSRHEFIQRPQLGSSRVSGPLPPLPPRTPEIQPDTSEAANSTMPSRNPALPDRAPQTAPPGESSFFSRPGVGQYSDPFANPSLISIPQTIEEQSPVDSPQQTVPGKSRRQRNYPLSGGDEDREESIGLVHGSSDSVESQPGIRLVTSSATRI